MKYVAAIAGGAAVVALGAFGLSHGQPTAVATSNMNVGSTVTETTPPAAPATSLAVPALKGNTPPSGFATTH